MVKSYAVLVATAITSGVLLAVSSASVPAMAAQAPLALAGSVSSAAEGMMEGVLVSAKKDGSNITVTVASDEHGHYGFPASRLSPGHYALIIRAGGYDLDGPNAADVTAGKTTDADIKLKKAADLSMQLSNTEWLNSLPGTDQQKQAIGGCVGCHTLDRILRSTHTPNEFMDVFARMASYSQGSTPDHPQPLEGERTLNGTANNTPQRRAAAEYLASVNLSKNPKWPYALQTLPRPKGKATHFIVTEYDIPRKGAQPHDVVISNGKAYYADFGRQFIGEMDPKTGKVTEYKVPVIRPTAPTGLLDVEADPQGNIWAAMMYQTGIVKFDPKTKKMTHYELPAEFQRPGAQESMVAPNFSNVDGKVYMNNQYDHSMFRLDVKTGKLEQLGILKNDAGEVIQAYGMPSAPNNNNLYLLNFFGTKIGMFNAETKKVTIYTTKFPNSHPRRGHADDQGRLWFAEFGGNAIGMFDPKTEAIKEWQVPIKWSYPYDAVSDNKGHVWTAGMESDYVTRLDPQTGEMVDYLLPRHTSIRRVFYDKASDAFWVGSNLGASIVKLEVLN